MPLRKGSSSEIVSANIAELIKSGHSKEQAAAIAYKEAGLSQDCGVGYALFHNKDGVAGRLLSDGATTRVMMADRLTCDGPLRKTSDGYLTGYANVARTGIQVYKGYELGRPNMQDVSVYRPPNEVFAKDAMHSMAHRPVTLTHPNVAVNAKNWNKYSKGITGDEVVRDGDHVKVPIVLMDQSIIDAYERDGIKELSMGYSTDLKWTPGKTEDGVPYDAVQTAIRANHLALVPVARGGATLRLGDARKCPACGSTNNDGMTCTDCGADMSDPMHDGQWSALRALAQLPFTGDQKPYWLWDRDFTEESRKKLAKSGAAMPDGSFPISNTSDLHNAIKAVGRAKNYDAAKAHIISRARALGATSELPDDWKSSTKDAGFRVTTQGRKTMSATIIIDGAPVEVADELSAAVVKNKINGLKALYDAEKDKADKADEDAKKNKKNSDDMEDGFKKQLATKDGEIVALKSQLADAKVTPEKLDALVKDRLAVIKSASLVLDAKTFSFDGKSVEDIRRATVAAKIGDSAAKLMADEAINGAFTVLTADASKNGGTAHLARALFDSQSNGNRGVVDIRDQALADQEYNMNNAWKPGFKPRVSA